MLRIVFIALLVLLPGSGISAYHAHAEPVTVEVTAEGETALVARSNGLQSGERKALLKVLGQRMPERAADIVARIGPEKAGQLVKKFDVLQEKTTARTYAARIAYEFDQERLDRIIAEERGLVPEIDSTSLLILPLWQEENSLLLWEAGNVWRSILSGIALQEGRGKLILPFGDPQDAFIMDHETILAGEREALVKLAERYGTKNVVIAQARNVAEIGEPVHIQVLLRRPASQLKEEILSFDYEAEQPSDSQTDVLSQAARDIAQRLMASTEQYSLFLDEEARRVKARIVRAEFRHNREWKSLKRAFEGLPQVDYIDIGAISPTYAQLTFYFRGTDTIIRRALMARGLEVGEVDQYWLVRLPQ